MPAGVGVRSACGAVVGSLAAGGETPASMASDMHQTSVLRQL